MGGLEIRSWYWHESSTLVREHLAGGGVVVIPTESSYGLGVDPRDREGIERVFEIKGRPAGKPVSVVGASLDQLSTLGIDLSAPVLAVARQVWPAALTAVVPIRVQIAASAGYATLAVRVPAHSRLRRLLIEIGSPLTATSANTAGDDPVTAPGALVAWLRTRKLRASVLIVDDGSLPGGPPSTLIDWVDPRMNNGEIEGLRILRSGAVSHSMLLQRMDRGG